MSKLKGFLAACALLALPGPAAAEIIVSPLRQVLTRQQPLATYEVSNVSDRIIEGRVGWTDLSAVETGYEPASPAVRAKLSAAPYLVISPARFRLEPGKRTKVTVQVKKGAAIPSGERRSHLLIETTPVRTPLRRTGGGLEVDVGLGISTPVILRSGLAAPAVSFTQTKLVRDDEGMLELKTSLSRSGKYSALGRLVAVMNSNGAQTTIAEIDNVALHVDTPLRTLTLPLGETSLPPGMLTLRYVGTAEYANRVLAKMSDFQHRKAIAAERRNAAEDALGRKFIAKRLGFFPRGKSAADKSQIFALAFNRHFFDARFEQAKLIRIFALQFFPAGARIVGLLVGRQMNAPQDARQFNFGARCFVFENLLRRCKARLHKARRIVDGNRRAGNRRINIWGGNHRRSRRSRWPLFRSWRAAWRRPFLKGGLAASAQSLRLEHG
jgi:hypothetical protein